MMVIGIDVHKRSHTAVVTDEMGRRQAVKTGGTTTEEHLKLLRWANSHSVYRFWSIEDCRHLSRRLERDLIAAGEAVVRVPPKLMAHARDSARTYGTSDPIDALAVARAVVVVESAAAICDRPVLCTHTNRTSGTSLASAPQDWAKAVRRSAANRAASEVR